MSNVFVDWVVQKYFAGPGNTWLACTENLFLEVGNFDSAQISAECVARSNLQVFVKTAMSANGPDSRWVTCTNGTISFSSNPEYVKIAEGDAVPLRQFLKFEVGHGSLDWSGYLTLRVMLSRNEE